MKSSATRGLRIVRSLTPAAKKPDVTPEIQNELQKIARAARICLEHDNWRSALSILSREDHPCGPTSE